MKVNKKIFARKSLGNGNTIKIAAFSESQLIRKEFNQQQLMKV